MKILGVKYVTVLLAFLLPTIALAGAPTPWQLGFQEAASPMMEQLNDFHNFLLVIITVIAVFVLILLAYICFRFSEKRNKKPSKTSHNTLLEIVWTTVPILILIAIFIPSMRILHYVEDIPEADMTIKVIGYQWYWGYEYPDQDGLAFESYIIEDKDLGPDDIRLLEVDNRVVLPVDTNIRIQLTAADVIHAWAVPALGVKIDAIPGRLNEAWVRISKPGVYYGQCSELCGVKHGFMPIAIEAVSKEEFKRWVKKAKKKFAANAPAETYELSALVQ